MRAFGLLAASLAIVPGVLAKSAIVFFEDKNTPDSVIQKAKDDIIADGGEITHEYTIIKCATPSTSTMNIVLTIALGDLLWTHPWRL